MSPRTDPARRCRKVDEWPEADRLAWERALQPSRLLTERRSAAARWRPETRHKNRRGYGRWITFLVTSGRGTNGHPAERVTPDALEAYIEELRQQGVSLWTQRNRVAELLASIRAIGPQQDWGWLSAILNDLEWQAREAYEPPMPELLTPDVLARCLDELAAIEAVANPPGNKLAIRHLDWLMLALMAATGLRRGNFAAITLDRHLRETSSGSLIVFDRSETKTHRRAEHPVPSYLEAHLRTYIAVYRPLLLGTKSSDRLWLSIRGNPMDGHGVYLRITELCQKAFGAPLNPHAFRSIGATTVAILAPEEIGAVPAFLQHTNPKTSEEYYLRASSMAVGRRYGDTIRELRRSLPPPPEWNIRPRARRRHRGKETLNGK